ncbi:MAG: hypothetical protein ACRCXA_13110 [Peptostreptococcaceae bacterium]
MNNVQNLNLDILKKSEKKHHEKVLNSPIKIMQVGDGNFLISFFDWMIDKAIKCGKYEGSIALTCSRNNDKK